MSPSKTATRKVKAELSRRADLVTQPEFLDSQIRPFLDDPSQSAGAWQSRLIQLDGTGACTVEIVLGGEQRVFAKLFPDDSGKRIYEQMLMLRAAGFGDGERYQVVDPLAFVDEYRMMLTRPAAGRAVADHIASDQKALIRGCEESGAWLAKLHEASSRYGTPQPLLESGELLPLTRRLAKMLCRRPRYLDLALDMIEKLEELAAKSVEGHFVQCHGQYRPIHVFVSEETATVIDLDRSHPCDPARDIAEFLHRTRMTTFWRLDTVEPADDPTDAFLAAYRSGISDKKHLNNLRFHWARYVFHSLNNKLKGKADSEDELDRVADFYRAEFDRIRAGRFV